MGQILIALPIDRQLRDRLKAEAGKEGVFFSDLVCHACQSLLKVRRQIRDMKGEGADAPVSH